MPAKQPRRGRLWLADGSRIRLRLERPGHVWAYDFVEDRTHDGRKFRILTVIDEYTRECLALPVGRQLRSDDPLRETIELEEELALILEWLLAAWHPTGIEIGIDPAFENRVGMTRSEFRENAIHVEIPIEPASAHDLIAAISTTSELDGSSGPRRKMPGPREAR